MDLDRIGFCNGPVHTKADKRKWYSAVAESLAQHRVATRPEGTTSAAYPSPDAAAAAAAAAATAVATTNSAAPLTAVAVTAADPCTGTVHHLDWTNPC